MRPIVLASLDWIRPGDPRAGLGTASIASALRAEGGHVEVVADAVNRAGFDAESYVQRVVTAAVAAGNNAVVAGGAFVWNEPEIQRLLPAIRQNSRATVVVGGPQVSYTPKHSLEGIYPAADIFVRGHAEDAMVAIATGTHAEGADGVHIAGAIDSGTRAEVDLKRLPSPHLDGTLPVGPFVRWETQRGCVFACSFCQHRQAGVRLRRHDLGDDRLHREVAAFAEAGVRRIAVLDPTFNTDRKRAVGLLHVMRDARLRAQLSLQCRFELVEDSFLDALSGLDVVLEFGLQTVHSDEGLAVGRPNDLAKVATVIDKLHTRGIPFEISLIYGLPHQTLDSFRRSVDWCLNRGVPRVRAWPLMLLRGTPLDMERARWGYVESAGERIPIVKASSTFTERDHAEMARIAASLDAGLVACEAA